MDKEMQEQFNRVLHQQWKVEGLSGLPQVWTADRQTCITDRVFNHTENAIAQIPNMIKALKEMLETGDHAHMPTLEAKAVLKALNIDWEKRK